MIRDWYRNVITRLFNRVYPRRLADEVIGTFLHRWFLVRATGEPETHTTRVGPHVRRSRFCNVYVHHWISSDDDRALHDHPWWSVSIVLSGRYREVLADRVVERRAGDIIVRRPRTAHRIELVYPGIHPWTLVITGPKVRGWGFRTAAGFIPWRDYVEAPEEDSGS